MPGRASCLIATATLVFFTGAARLAAEPTIVGFSDLVDPAARAFVDPYLEMGPDRMNDLRAFVRLDTRLAEADLPGQVRQRLEAQREDARQALVAAGYDIEALLAARWDIAQKRRAAQIATNPSFDGADVRLEGYLIPAGTGPDGRAIGYIVPVVGMCSHIPAPPPNELVRLHFDPEMGTDSIYLPVSVSGTLRTEASDETIHLLDGHVRMQSLWRLDTQAVVIKGPVPPETAVPANHDPLAAPTVYPGRQPTQPTKGNTP